MNSLMAGSSMLDLAALPETNIYEEDQESSNEDITGIYPFLWSISTHITSG